MNRATCAAALLASVGLVALTTGCMGRTPAPVNPVQPQDHFAGCPAIMAESSANNLRIGELGSEQGAKVAQNVAAGVVGLFIWPVWLAMDFQGAAGTESAALQVRQQHLATLATEKHCSTVG
jgi:hypothetical protein